MDTDVILSSLAPKGCTQIRVIVNGEDYAIVGGFVGGLVVVLLYVLYLRLVDLCYRQNHIHHVEDKEMYSPRARSMGSWPGRDVSEMRVGSADAAYVNAYSSPATTHRQVRFDGDVIDRTGSSRGTSHPGFPHGRQQAAVWQTEGEMSWMRQQHGTGAMRGDDTLSPPPRW